MDVTWTVVSALPGTRIEWEAEWCPEGSIAVHAWLVSLDATPDDDESIWDVDTSLCIGFPMVLASGNQLQVARYADLDGTPGSVIEPA